MEHGHLIFVPIVYLLERFERLVFCRARHWIWVIRPRASTLYIIQGPITSRAIRTTRQTLGRRHTNAFTCLHKSRAERSASRVRLSAEPQVTNLGPTRMRCRGLGRSTHNRQIAIFPRPIPTTFRQAYGRHSLCNGAASMSSWPHRLRCDRKSFGGRF